MQKKERIRKQIVSTLILPKQFLYLSDVMNQNVEAFENLISTTLGDEMNESGTALYSSFETLTKGKFLILGINPGGDPNIIKTSIKQSLEKCKDPTYNAYYENWNGGKHRLQENLKELFKFVNVDLRNICATNLIYKRSKRESALVLNSLPKYRIILSALLKIVEPEIIITFGKRPFNELINFFQEHLLSTTILVQSKDSGHGKWVINFAKFKCENKWITIIGFPHFSIYTIYNKQPQLK